MTLRPRLLCYGHDDLLLYTRTKILEREFLVEICTHVSGLNEILERGAVDVAVMCHSVPDVECEAVIHRVREHSPGVKVLVLYEAAPEFCSEHSDKTMECLEGPSTLVDDVHALIEEDAQGSAELQ